jgi:hypothetical protein
MWLMILIVVFPRMVIFHFSRFWALWMAPFVCRWPRFPCVFTATRRDVELSYRGWLRP